MKFLDIYNQDKNIINLILKDIKKVIKNTNFILGEEVNFLREISQNTVNLNLL